MLFFMSMGAYAFPLLLLTFVIIILTVIKIIQLLSGRGTDSASLERGLNAILFWGCISAVLGFLGQITGHYRSLNAMLHAEAINPNAVYMGLIECLRTTIYGLTQLLFAALFWFGLRSWVQHIKRRRSQMV